MPVDLMWKMGTDITAIPLEGFIAVKAVCSLLLSNKDLLEDLKTHRYDLAIVDLINNECGLAIAHYLGKLILITCCSIRSKFIDDKGIYLLRYVALILLL